MVVADSCCGGIEGDGLAKRDSDRPVVDDEIKPALFATKLGTGCWG